MQDGQSSAAAPAVSGAAVPAVNVDAPNLSRNVSASNATHPDPAPSATGAGSDDYRVPSTPGPHHSVAQHGGGADGTPSRSHIGVLSGAQVTPSVSTGTPMSCQPTPEAPSAGVRSRRSLADQLPDGPSSSTQECQPDAHITLDELTTWFKDVKLLQTGPNAAAPTVFKSSQAIRQGIEVFGHLLGMKGTNARTRGELHNWKSTPANKVNANEVLKGIGSGSLLAPGSRWYATVQKAEEVHRMQSQLADIHAQNLGLKAQIEDMKIKQTAELERLRIEQSTKMKDMKIKQTAELERLKLKQNALLARIKSQDLFSKTALGLKRKKLQSEIRALHAAEREARRDRADKQKAWVDEEAQRDVLWKWDLTKIIERGNTNADGTPKPNWMGLRGAQTRDHNVTEYKLTDHSPAWLHTFVRYAQKQVTAWFKRRNEALTGWYPGKSQFRRGGSFCSALGHMVKQSDGDDGQGVFTISQILKGVLGWMPGRVSLAKAAEDDKGLIKLLRKAVQPILGGSLHDICTVVVTNSIPVRQSCALLKAAAGNPTTSHHKSAPTAHGGTTGNKRSNPSRSAHTGKRKIQEGCADINAACTDYLGIRPTGSDGAAADLMKASTVALEIAPYTDHIVRHALQSHIMVLKGSLLLARAFRKKFPDASSQVEVDNDADPDHFVHVSLPYAVRKAFLDVTGFTEDQWLCLSWSESIPVDSVAEVLTTVLGDESDAIPLVFCQSVVLSHTSHGSLGMLLHQLDSMVCELLELSCITAFDSLVAMIAYDGGADYTTCDPLADLPGTLSNDDHALQMRWVALNANDIGDPCPTVGLRWRETGATKPSQGRSLTNRKLEEALRCGTIFTQQQWDKFGVTDLCYGDFIKSGDSYFTPVGNQFEIPSWPSAPETFFASGLEWLNVGTTQPDEGLLLTNQKLMTVLSGKAESTIHLEPDAELTIHLEPDQWDEIGISDLNPDDYVLCNHSYFRPAVRRAATIIPPRTLNDARMRCRQAILNRMCSSTSRWLQSFMYDGAKVNGGPVKRDLLQLLLWGCMPYLQESLMAREQEKRATRHEKRRPDKDELSTGSVPVTATGTSTHEEQSQDRDRLPARLARCIRRRQVSGKRGGFETHAQASHDMLPLGVALTPETSEAVRQHILEPMLPCARLLGKWDKDTNIAPGLHFHLTSAGQTAMANGEVFDVKWLSSRDGRDRTLNGEVPWVVLPVTELWRTDMKAMWALLGSGGHSDDTKQRCPCCDDDTCMKTGTAHQSCYSVMSLLPGETLQEVADRQDMFLWDIIRMNLPGLCVEEHLSPFRSGKVEDSTLLESARSKLAVLTSDPGRSWAVELNSIAPPGGKWRDIGPEMPPTGEILMNDRLSKALESKHSFTTDELAMFEIQNLSYNSYIQVGGDRGNFFRPSDNPTDHHMKLSQELMTAIERDLGNVVLDDRKRRFCRIHYDAFTQRCHSTNAAWRSPSEESRANPSRAQGVHPFPAEQAIMGLTVVGGDVNTSRILQFLRQAGLPAVAIQRCMLHCKLSIIKSVYAGIFYELHALTDTSLSSKLRSNVNEFVETGPYGSALRMGELLEDNKKDRQGPKVSGKPVPSGNSSDWVLKNLYKIVDVAYGAALYDENVVDGHELPLSQRLEVLLPGKRARTLKMAGELQEVLGDLCRVDWSPLLGMYWVQVPDSDLSPQITGQGSTSNRQEPKVKGWKEVHHEGMLSALALSKDGRVPRSTLENLSRLNLSTLSYAYVQGRWLRPVVAADPVEEKRLKHLPQSLRRLSITWTSSHATTGKGSGYGSYYLHDIMHHIGHLVHYAKSQGFIGYGVLSNSVLEHTHQVYGKPELWRAWVSTHQARRANALGYLANNVEHLQGTESWNKGVMGYKILQAQVAKTISHLFCRGGCWMLHNQCHDKECLKRANRVKIPRFDDWKPVYNNTGDHDKVLHMSSLEKVRESVDKRIFHCAPGESAGKRPQRETQALLTKIDRSVFKEHDRTLRKLKDFGRKTLFTRINPSPQTQRVPLGLGVMPTGECECVWCSAAKYGDQCQHTNGAQTEMYDAWNTTVRSAWKKWESAVANRDKNATPIRPPCARTNQCCRPECLGPQAAVVVCKHTTQRLTDMLGGKSSADKEEKTMFENLRKAWVSPFNASVALQFIHGFGSRDVKHSLQVLKTKPPRTQHAFARRLLTLCISDEASDTKLYPQLFKAS